MSARFEFRIFDKDLTEVKEFLDNRYNKKSTYSSSDEYILYVKNNSLNVKIRDNKLDVKKLETTLKNCEKWSLLFKENFPITVKILEDLYDINLSALISEKEFLDSSKLKKLLKKSNNFKIVTVEKERTFFKKGEVSSEFTYIKIGGESFQTVAFESENSNALQKEVQNAGLSDKENQNYGKFLREQNNLR